ncbi:MAG: hypothetical protein WC755_09625 [Candidatus Woesearchaeota archaeon]|jgi:hypothetical protein
MKDIYFPLRYKKALINKTKNTTIRIGNEIGKYEVGKTYFAKSYAGNEWDIKIIIKDVIPTTFGDLEKYGIPKRTISSIMRKEKVDTKTYIEIVRFDYS